MAGVFDSQGGLNADFSQNWQWREESEIQLIVDVIDAQFHGQRGDKGTGGDPSLLTGDPGSKGAAGPGGSTCRGATGPTGTTGPAGNKGSIGPAGSKGASGDQGPVGVSGDKGAAGVGGDKGGPGPSPGGQVGDKGVDGPSGNKGSSGPVGNKGAVGAKGVAGNKGSTGDNGDPGMVLSKGQKGETGATGDVGFVGSSGPVGDDGDSFLVASCSPHTPTLQVNETFAGEESIQYVRVGDGVTLSGTFRRVTTDVLNRVYLNLKGAGVNEGDLDPSFSHGSAAVLTVDSTDDVLAAAPAIAYLQDDVTGTDPGCTFVVVQFEDASAPSSGALTGTFVIEGKISAP